MAKSAPAATRFIFVTILIDVIGFGLVIPVLPRLIQDLIAGDISEAGKWGGWLTFAYAIMQFIFAPVLGNLSDKYGRRPVLLVSLFGFGLDYILLSLAPTIGWLFAGRLIAGITGASITTASAYMADISTNENRAQNFGMIGAAFGIGFIIGPVLGGAIGQFGARLPFVVAAILALLNALYGYFILPESLAKENRRPFSWKRANPAGSLLQLKKYPAMGGLIFSLVLIYLAAHAVQSTWTFINIEKFNWSEAMIGYSLGLVGILVALVQGVLIKYLNAKIGNERSVYSGIFFYAVGLLLFAFASQSWMMFVFLVPYCLGGITMPALQSIIAAAVPANEQGELQGALTSLASATSIAGPLMMTHLFAYFTSEGAPVQFAGAPFLLGAIFMVISALIAWNTLYRKPKKYQ